MSKTGAARVRAYRQRRKEAGLPDNTRTYAAQDRRETYNENAMKLKPFVGCDGEGCGKDDLERQLYMLFRMGTRELFTGSRLTTEEILDFICDEPSGSILVGFSFGYDVTMILRDLPKDRLERLFAPKDYFGENAGNRYVWYKNFDIEYLPRQYFRVRRVVVTHDNGRTRRAPVKGSTRTIYETFGFFQMSFVKAIENFECGTDAQRKSIAANKSRRGDFTSIDQEERDYCALECELLAELMEKLRGYSYAAGIRPSTWSGAGKLASAMHNSNNTPTNKEVNKRLPDGLSDFAAIAYYGGRFEISRTGLIGSAVYEYDIRSAYPDAMRKLPCLEHGEWTEANAAALRSCKGLYVAACTFKHPDNGHGQMCGLPVRGKQGSIYWPLQGGGVYWSPEIESAKLLGAKIRFKAGWIYRKNCDCHPFNWIEKTYEYRRSIGSKGPGYPIKLGINALYGKLAQRIGNGKFANLIWAGLITAMTREKLNRAIALNPGGILMVATDAVYSDMPLDLDEGERLGQWEGERLADMFIVQPGLYWSPDLRKKKSRGLPGKFFETGEKTQEFERKWKSWQQFATDDFPAVDVPLTTFTGLKLALSRGKPETAGTWVDDKRTISFDYTGKRQGHIWSGDCIVTAPKPGRPGLLSLPHAEFIKADGQEAWEKMRSVLDDQPDYIDLSSPFRD